MNLSSFSSLWQQTEYLWVLEETFEDVMLGFGKHGSACVVHYVLIVFFFFKILSSRCPYTSTTMKQRPTGISHKKSGITQALELSCGFVGSKFILLLTKL